jgi:hypothetical protein
MIYAFVERNWIDSILILIGCWPLALLKKVTERWRQKYTLYRKLAYNSSRHLSLRVVQRYQLWLTLKLLA